MSPWLEVRVAESTRSPNVRRIVALLTTLSSRYEQGFRVLGLGVLRAWHWGGGCWANVG